MTGLQVAGAPSRASTTKCTTASTARYRKQPRNVGEVLDGIRWLYADCLPVQCFGPLELRIDYVSWPDGSRGVTLLRNGPLDAAKDVPFTVRSPSPPRDGRLYKPGQAEPVELLWKPRDSSFETLLPQVMRHAVLSYRLQDGASK